MASPRDELTARELTQLDDIKKKCEDLLNSSTLEPEQICCIILDDIKKNETQQRISKTSFWLDIFRNHTEVASKVELGLLKAIPIAVTHASYQETTTVSDIRKENKEMMEALDKIFAERDQLVKPLAQHAMQRDGFFGGTESKTKMEEPIKPSARRPSVGSQGD